MVYINIPGLPDNLDVKYRPPRISLFPLSYRERAHLRSIHRAVLRQIETVPDPSEKGKAKDGKTVTFQLELAKEACKGNGGKKEDKKVDKKQDRKDGDSDDKNEQSKAKDKGKNEDNKGKNEDDKGKKDNKKDDSKLKVPDYLKAFLPYPFTSPNADSFWGNSNFQRPFPEKPSTHKEDPTAWNMDQKLETARRADERYAWSWLSEQEGSHQKDAFQWLAERDTQRQATLAQATQGLAGLSLDPGVGRRPSGLAIGPQVTNFGHPGHSYPNFCSGNHSISLQGCVDQYGNIRLGDGTMVIMNGQCAEAQRQQGPLDQWYNDSRSNLPNHQQQQWNNPLMWATQQPPFQNPQNPVHQQPYQGFPPNGPQRPPVMHNQSLANNSKQHPGAWNGAQGPQNFNNFNGSHNAPGNVAWPGPNNNHPPHTWGHSNGMQNSGQWNSNVNQTNNTGFKNARQRHNGWNSGQNNGHGDHNNVWGQNPNNDNVSDNRQSWGGGNDENSKPNNGFTSFANHENQGWNQSQQENDENDDGNDSLKNHPFFSGGAAPPRGENPTMSGAKGRRSRKPEEYTHW